MTLTVPSKLEVPGLAAAVNVNEPLPVPLLPLVIVNQLELLTADQTQPF
jgi:hypothetical protein